MEEAMLRPPSFHAVLSSIDKDSFIDMLKGTVAAAGKTDQHSAGDKVRDYVSCGNAVMRCLVIVVK